MDWAMPFNGGLDKSKSLFSDSTLCFCSNPQDVNLLKRRRYHLSGKTCHKYFDKVFIILKNRWLFRKDCQLRFADRNMFNNFKVFFWGKDLYHKIRCILLLINHSWVIFWQLEHARTNLIVLRFFWLINPV